MKLKDDLGAPARLLYFLFGVVLAAATIATAYAEWPLVNAGKESPLVFVLLALIALPLSLFIIVWACIGRHREWRIADDHVRVRLLSLTSWQRDFRIHPEEIESLTRDQYTYEDKDGRIAYGVTVALRNGRTLHSPHTFDAAQAQLAWEGLQRLCRRGQFVSGNSTGESR